MRSLLLLALALAGCSTPFVQPEVEVPGQFAQALPSEDEPEVAWWEGYGDPVLSSLMRRAAVANRDIKIAAERVRAARAGVTISRSSMLPNVGARVAGERYDNRYGGRASEADPEVRSLSGGVDISWEIDLSGACARAPRQPPPTQLPPSTACAECACSC